MPNAVQLTKNGQPVYPRTDVSLVVGLQDAIKLPPVKVTTLPTASAETAGKMYYVGPDQNDEYERYITSIGANETYDWIDLGDTSIPLPSIADNLTTDDANTALSAKQGVVLEGEITQLEAKVDGSYIGWSLDNGKVNRAILELYAANLDMSQLAYLQIRLVYYTSSKYYNAIYARKADDSLLTTIMEDVFDTESEAIASLQSGQIRRITSQKYILFSGVGFPLNEDTREIYPINNLAYSPHIAVYLRENTPVENSEKLFTSGGAYAIKQTILSASQNTTTGGINLNLGTTTVANIAKEEDLLSQDFGRNIITQASLSNANITIGETLILGKRYYVKFTLSADTSVSLLLRTSSGTTVQTILSGVTLPNGTYIIPFDCADTTAAILRVGTSTTIANYSNIYLYENKALTLMTLGGWCDNNVINGLISEFYYPIGDISEVTSIDIRFAYYNSDDSKWYNAIYIKRGVLSTVNALSESFDTKQDALDSMAKGLKAIENGGQIFIKQSPVDAVVMSVHHIKDFSELNNMPIIALSRKLAGKSVIWEGDSIAADNEGDSTGWRTRIESLFGIVGTNYSRGGSTFTANLDGLATDYNISLRIDNELNNPSTYLIMDGGTNDADRIGLAVQWDGDNIVPKASLPAAFGSWNIYDFSGPFDRDTFCGAVEYTIKKILTTMRGVKLGYILAPKMGIANHIDSAGRKPFNRKYYMDTVASICKKWGVPVLNLWDNCWLNPNLPQHYDSSKTKQENIDAGNYYLDGQHLTGKGYDYISPLIAEWIINL